MSPAGLAEAKPAELRLLELVGEIDASVDIVESNLPIFYVEDVHQCHRWYSVVRSDAQNSTGKLLSVDESVRCVDVNPDRSGRRCHVDRSR